MCVYNNLCLRAVCESGCGCYDMSTQDHKHTPHKTYKLSHAHTPTCARVHTHEHRSGHRSYSLLQVLPLPGKNVIYPANVLADEYRCVCGGGEGKMCVCMCACMCAWVCAWVCASVSVSVGLCLWVCLCLFLSLSVSMFASVCV